MAFNLLLESNNTVSPRDVVFGHYPECSAREQEEEPENDLAFAVVLDQGRGRQPGARRHRARDVHAPGAGHAGEPS
jgi:hypothetical protein